MSWKYPDIADASSSATPTLPTECEHDQDGHRHAPEYFTSPQHSSLGAVHSHLRQDQLALDTDHGYAYNQDRHSSHIVAKYPITNVNHTSIEGQQQTESVYDEHSDHGGNQQEQQSAHGAYHKDNHPHHQGVAKHAPTPRTFLERIPITGLHNYFHADGKFEKRFWTIVLLLSTGITLKYLIPTVVHFAEQMTLVEATQTSGADLPFPHIFACVWGGVNGTYLTEKFAVSSRELSTNNSRVELLARRLNVSAAFLVDSSIASMTSSPTGMDTWIGKWASAQTEVIYRGTLILGPDAENVDGFYTNAMYRCDKVLIKCEFRGVEFPCCPEGDRVYSAANVACYKINVSAAFSNQAHTSSSRQSELTLLSSIDSRYLPYHIIEHPVLSLTYGETLLTTFDVPDSIPASSLVFVKLARKHRILMRDCMKQYEFDLSRRRTTHQHLIEYFQNMTDPTKYSVNRCTFAQLLETISTMCGCIPHYDTLHPDDESICKPAHMFACLAHAFDGFVQMPAANGGNGRTGKDMFSYLKQEATECLPLCDTWSYESHMTIASLGGQYGNDPYIVYNKVIITVDEEYRLENDVLKIDAAAFLASIGDSLGLLLGFSLVSFIQGAYWGISAIIVKKKHRVKLQRQNARHSNRVPDV